MCGTDCLLAVIAIIFPPLPVWVKRGFCGADSLINIALCVLGFLPGLLHSWYIIFSSPDPSYEELRQRDPERGHVQNQSHTYYVVANHGGQPQPQYAPQQQGYGTVNSSAPSKQFPQPKAAGFVQPQSQPQAGSSSGEALPPPTYQQATQDNKIQRT